MPEPIKSVLVVPVWCISPFTGGGQRTGIFFSALKSLGPTEVVLLGHNLRREAVEHHFPGHAGLHLVEVEVAKAQRLAGLQLQLDRARRYLMFWRLYRSMPAAQASIEERLGEGTDLFVYREFRTFCWSVPDPGGAKERREILHFVDVDDLDDQKLQSGMQDFLRNATLARAYGYVMLPLLRRVMRRKLALARLVWLSASEDRARLPGNHVSVIPNVPFEAASHSTSKPSSRRDLLFVGSGGYAPNSNGVRWFLQSCWPEIRARHPESRFRIVGSGDWRGLADEFRGMAGVDFVGRVDSVATEYDRARFSIVPIFSGGGTKIKLIESCGFGRPVVSTSHSARGFGEDIRRLIPQADVAAEFIRHCDRLLDDNVAIDALADELRTLQQERYSRQAVEAEIVEQIRASRAGPIN